MDILTDILGMNVTYAPWKKEKRLPFYIAAGYDFKKAEIDGCYCILIYPKEDLPTLPALKRQIQRIQQIEMLPVVIRVTGMSAFRRKNMIENKVPFIIEEKQIYLPFMAAYLQGKEDAEKKKLEKYMISSQVLFLLYMYRGCAQLRLADADRELPYSAMTITRAARQLEESGLFFAKKDGVNKILCSKYSKKELYIHAKEYLTSPIVKEGLLDKEKVTKEMLFAGTSALAEKTMLNSEVLEVYAVYQKDCNLENLRKELLDPNKQVKVEVWKYPPQLFSEGGVVDAISLALSLMEETDERIGEAVEEMLDALWGDLDGNRI